MIKIFRKIRQQLLSDKPTNGRIGKYLLYAIGEIALVMIGILLALQVNNWNENQKAKYKEAVILNNLKSEMEESLTELNTDYERHLKYYQSTLNVYKYIQTKPTITDSMYLDFYNCILFSYFFPKTSTYETLKSGNLDVIKSDSLKTLISDVYESGFQRIIKKVETRNNAARLLFPYYQKNFRTKIKSENVSISSNSFYNNAGVPNNYETLINDSEFETLIVEAIKGRTMFNSDFERTIGLVENGIFQIEKYLKD